MNCALTFGATAGTCHSAPSRDGRWRRGELNPRPKSATAEAYMLSSIPFVSPASLRMSKKRDRLARLVLTVAFRTET